MNLHEDLIAVLVRHGLVDEGEPVAELTVSPDTVEVTVVKLTGRWHHEKRVAYLLGRDSRGGPTIDRREGDPS